MATTNPVRTAFLGALATCAAGCEFLTGEAVREWSEEVAVERRVVTVERRVEFAKNRSLAGDYYADTTRRSTLVIRDGSVALPAWTDVLLPLVLYQDTGTIEWVLVASTTDCQTYRQRGRPKPTYWEFRLRGPTWVEAPLSSTSLERKTNLLYLYDDPLPTRHFTVASKARFQSSARTDERYLSIKPDSSFNCG